MEKARSRFQLPTINGGMYRLIRGAEGMIVRIPTTINNNFRAALYLSWEYSMSILLQRKIPDNCFPEGKYYATDFKTGNHPEIGDFENG